MRKQKVCTDSHLICISLNSLCNLAFQLRIKATTFHMNGMVDISSLSYLRESFCFYNQYACLSMCNIILKKHSFKSLENRIWWLS